MFNKIFVDLFHNIKSWKNFKERLISSYDNNLPKTEILSKVGKDFEKFAKLYFQYEPSVKNDYKNVWLLKETPYYILEKLNIPI